MSECNEIMNLRHEVSDLRRRVENMAVALTDNGLNDISLRVALAVEDQFAELCSCLTGRRIWNYGG